MNYYKLVFRGGVIRRNSTYPKTPDGEQQFIDEMLSMHIEKIEQIIRDNDGVIVYERGK